MKKSIISMLAAAMIAVVFVSCEEDPEEVKSYYELDGVEHLIDSTMFWYQSGMGGDPYIRLITPVDGQENPDLLKLYPNKGINDLPGVYNWDAQKGNGTYDVGYTAGYSGMQMDWTGDGIEGCSDLVIQMKDGKYNITGDFIILAGTWDFSANPPAFNEIGNKTLKLDYTGDITPLGK